MGRSFIKFHAISGSLLHGNGSDRMFGGGNSGLDSKVAIFGYLFICLNLLFFDWIASANHYISYSYYVSSALTREDHWVEYLTAAWFFLASLLFFATAGMERNVFRRTVYVLGGIALLYVAGEEISWGQRIIGFSTPGFLLDLNVQREFSLHNIRGLTVGVSRWTNFATLTFCVVTGIAFFCGKKFLLGIPVPSVLLALGAMMIQHVRGSFALPTEFVLNLFILLFVIYAFLSRRAKLIAASISTAALALATSYFDGRPIFGGEVHEYLTGIVCMLLSIELALYSKIYSTKSRDVAQRPETAIVPPVSSPNCNGSNPPCIPVNRLHVDPAENFGLDSPRRKSGVCCPSTWLTVCFIVCTCSAGLALVHHFSDWSVAAAPSGEPTVRSTFDIYLTENRVIYFKEPCEPADVKEHFFLHLTPADARDLPAIRAQYGFDNLDFDFISIGTMFDGRCLATVALPRYAIVSIRTGQFIPGEGRVWKVEFPFRE